MKRLHNVPVDGGLLTVGEWGPAQAPPVVVIHGISGTHMSWNTFARLAGQELRIIAPDLRGRGRSTDLPGPYGMAAHAHDIAAALEVLGVEQATVMGHSMGAFVTLVFAHLYPERTCRGILVDGGLPLPPPPGASAEDLTAAILAPIEVRLSSPAGSLADYIEAWRAHPAFDRLTDDLLEYIEYDLLERDGELWASGSLEAIRSDGVSIGTDEDLLAALTARAATNENRDGFRPPPVEFLRATAGMADPAPPLYPLDAALDLGAHFQVPVTTLEALNHYTIVMGEAGAGELLAHVRGMIA